MLRLLCCLIDIDECALNVHDCDPAAYQCDNTPGSFDCICKDGYTLDTDVCVGKLSTLRILWEDLQLDRTISLTAREFLGILWPIGINKGTREKTTEVFPLFV